jgi:hypothetical protein
MFSRFKKKLAPERTEATKKPEVIKEPEPEVVKEPKSADKPESKEKTIKKTEKTKKKATTDRSTQRLRVPADTAGKKKPFIGIKEYSSVSEIAESIDNELAETKRALGEYLRQLDDRRAIAEQTQRLYNVVAKVADKKPSKGNPNSVDLNGLEVVVDATVSNELTAIENVVQSHQKRLMALQKARESLKQLDQADDTEGIKYLALEKEGIPEQILLKLA